MRLGRLLTVAIGCLILMPAAALAQSSIAGNVTDDTGGVLPGVTVEAASPVLIEGSRIGITDGTGNYNIVGLTPGTYAMTFTLPGFGTQVRDELILAADTAINIDVALAVGSVEETITVSGETPVVDVQQVQRVEVLSRETQEAIPTGRSLWSYALLIPGVKVHKPDVGGTAGAQQSTMFGRGLDGRHTTVEIDGMMVNTLIDDGRFQAYLNPMMTAETSYTTTGATAETQSGGMKMNMIPQEGGNQFSGAFFAGGTPSNFQSRNWNQRLGDLGIKEDTMPMIDKIYDLNASVGGPLARDRLWFFSSARRNIINNGVVNSITRGVGGGSYGDQAMDDNSITSAMTRLTWQMNTQNKLSVMFDKVRKRRFHQHDFGTDYQTAAASWHSPHYDTGTAKWTSTISNRMLAEFGFSLVYEDWDPGYQPGIFQTVPSDADMAFCSATPCFPTVNSVQHTSQLGVDAGGDPWYSVLQRRDGWLAFRYGAKDRQENNYSHRWSYQGSLSYVTGSHAFKFGGLWTWGQNRFTRDGNAGLIQQYEGTANPLGRTIPWMNCEHPNADPNIDAGLPCGTIGTPDGVLVTNNPSYFSGKLDYNSGIYAQDSWTLDRLTLNYGMRVDFAAASVPQLPKVGGRFVGGFTYDGIDDLPKFGPDLSPRLSAAYDVFGDARTALKFGWNKYVRTTGVNYPLRYGVAREQFDSRAWYDCELNMAGDACSGANTYGGNNDDVAQNWEIGPGNADLGFRSPNDVADDLSREHNRIWTAGIQQELGSGFSVSAEFRRRTYYNTWSTDRMSRDLSHWGAMEDGSGGVMPDPNATMGSSFDWLRPAPFAGSITIYNIDPDTRTLTDFMDRTRTSDYSQVYTGFELSMQGRLPNGGTLFGGWTMEDHGKITMYDYDTGSGAATRYGGETNDCADTLLRGDNPNRMRWCDMGAFPRPYRHEFKVSGTYPFSAGVTGDWNIGGSFQAYPGGGQEWSGLQEGFFVHRTSTDALYGTYSDTFYGQGNCVAPCVLGGRLVPESIAAAGTVADSTSGFWAPLVPLNSVKFEPYWTQVDINLAKVFNIGSWRYDARIELFNALNKGIEVWHTGSRNGRGSTPYGYQSLSSWERAEKILEGRVIRFAMTARF